jgi:S1-C subfamily serine protease
MKSTKKIIICAVLALCLIFTTSCSYTLGLLINNGSGAGTVGGQNDTPPQTNQQGGSNAGGTSDTQTGGGSSDSSEPKFHPDANDPAVPDTLDPATRTLLSTVAIDAKLDLRTSYPYYDDFYYGGSSDTTTEYTSYGSGVIYSIDREAGDAYIITNFHVVYNSASVTSNGISNNIKVYLYGMESDAYAIPATFVGGSLTQDLAVLKVRGSRILAESNAVAAIKVKKKEVRMVVVPIILVCYRLQAGLNHWPLPEEKGL